MIEGSLEGSLEEYKGAMKVGRKPGRKLGKKEANKQARKEGRKLGRKEGRKGGRKEEEGKRVADLQHCSLLLLNYQIRSSCLTPEGSLQPTSYSICSVIPVVFEKIHQPCNMTDQHRKWCQEKLSYNFFFSETRKIVHLLVDVFCYWGLQSFPLGISGGFFRSFPVKILFWIQNSR